MSEDNIVERIQNILGRHETVPQALKDELILLGLSEILQTMKEHAVRIEFLEKYKPYLQGLAWAVGVVALALLTMAITGRLQITITP